MPLPRIRNLQLALRSLNVLQAGITTKDILTIKNIYRTSELINWKDTPDYIQSQYLILVSKANKILKNNE